MAQNLIDTHKIGNHTKKLPTLLKTVKSIPDDKPYQIFLGSTQSSKLSLAPADIAAASKEIEANGQKIYVHTPYILNLATPFENSWQAELFQKYIQGSVGAGFKGVVIHVAKSTKQVYSAAVEIMRQNLLAAAEFATDSCPILLETPAGQGTETLKKMEEFCDFVKAFDDPRIRVCLDTCHVFACGHEPLNYIQKMLTDYGGLLKLVHYNDSQAACGSCVDRHALVGTGHIGLETMTQIAELCSENRIPMVIE